MISKIALSIFVAFASSCWASGKAVILDNIDGVGTFNVNKADVGGESALSINDYRPILIDASTLQPILPFPVGSCLIKLSGLSGECAWVDYVPDRLKISREINQDKESSENLSRSAKLAGVAIATLVAGPIGLALAPAIFISGEKEKIVEIIFNNSAFDKEVNEALAGLGLNSKLDLVAYLDSLESATFRKDHLNRDVGKYDYTPNIANVIHDVYGHRPFLMASDNRYCGEVIEVNYPLFKIISERDKFSTIWIRALRIFSQERGCHTLDGKKCYSICQGGRRKLGMHRFR